MKGLSTAQRDLRTTPSSRSRLLVRQGLVAAMVLWSAIRLAHGQQHEPGRSNLPPQATAKAAWDDLVCGPRCAQYLLRYYGQEVDLIDLVREIQWPDLENGASLEAVDNALKRRGIHTFGMQLAPHARLKWPYPALVLVKMDGAKLGHFVVARPSLSKTLDVWCGLRGIQRMSAGELAERSTGATLLTAPTRILNPDSAVEPEGTPAYAWWICGGCSVCVLFALLLTR